MLPVQKYFKIARENEAVFRNVLRDLKDHKEKRPMGAFVPEDLETEASLEDIFEKYSTGERYGRFTINNFTRPDKDSAVIFFCDVASLSGGGAELKYKVKEDNSVEYFKQGMIFMS